MGIEMGVGCSSHADVFAAGQEAAAQAVSNLARQQPDLVLVFCSMRFADPRMLRAVRSATGNAPLVGCTDAGGIVTSGPRRRSITVIGLVADKGAFVTGIERNISLRPRESGMRLSEYLLRQAQQVPRCLMNFPDGLSTNGSELIAGIQKPLGKEVRVTGASAADDLFFQKTFQFYNDEIATDSVPGVLFCGDLRVGIGVRHGWVPVGRSRKVTRASGHIIYQLDGRPAVSIYEDYLGLKREELMQDPLTNVTLTYPLGTEIRGRGEYLLRDPIRVGRAGSLVCTGEIPQGAEVRLMIGGYESALEAAQQSACDAVDQLGRRRLQGALIFCSVARQKMLGSEFQGEIDVVRDALGGTGVRLGGFYSYGEMASDHFHNESIVVVALG
jgi:hypothetical protein